MSAYPLLYRIQIHRIKNKHPEVILQGGLTSQLRDDLLWQTPVKIHAVEGHAVEEMIDPHCQEQQGEEK